MRRLTIIILTVILIHSPFCHAQQQSNWDEALDRYELLCQRCLELMDQQKKGAAIPRESITSLVTQLSLLKNTLSEARGSMTTAQKSRFDLIRRKFSGSGAAPAKQTKEAQGARPTPVPSRIASGSNPKAPEPSAKEATNANDSLSEARNHIELPSALSGLPAAGAESLSPSDNTLIQTEAMPQRTEKHRTQFLAAVQTGLFPELSYGGLVGFTSGKIGAYLKYRNDFRPKAEAASYTCDAEGFTPQGSRVWSNGTERKSRVAASAGAIWRPWERTAFYAGAGYGTRFYEIQDIGGNWARVDDLSAKGFSVNLGVLYMPGRHFFAGAGIDITAFRYTDLELSLGLRF